MKKFTDLTKEDFLYNIFFVDEKKVIEMIKEWIKFLEREGNKPITQYPHGVYQAAILREIFDIK
jgi:hypothetical protein